MFLTRMGVCSKFVMTGDSTQIDLNRKTDSGLLQAMRILTGIEGVSVIKFDERDIIRHKLVKKIVKAYEEEEKTTTNSNNNEPE
jgi:phosphate starvation-inducible PhoH-like protein